MKTYKINKGLTLMVLSAMLLGLNSCDNFLEEKPYTKYKEDDYYASPQRLSMATLAIYDVLSNQNTYGANIPILEAGTDLEQSRSTSISTNITDIMQVANYNIMSQNSQIEAIWQYLYDGVNRANTVIENVHKVPTKNEDEVNEVKKYLAEAKVLRAFFYLDIVRRWGDVPFRLKPASLSENLFLPRTPRSVIYDQIIADMEEAIPHLPWWSEDPTTLCRVSKGAAMGLLARTCLFAGGYSLYMDGTIKRPDNYLDYYRKADKVTRELIESKKHTLNTDYEKIFKNICENIVEPSECMFEIDMAFIYGASSNASGLGTNTTGVQIQNSGNLYNCSPKIFSNYFAWQKFDETGKDKRREISIANYYLDAIFTTKSKKVDIPVTQSDKWSCAKWRRDWHTSVPSNWAKSDLNNVVLRYSEVLLMRAEIVNELNGGPTDEAVELVNQVRRRGYGLPIATASDVADMPAEAKADHDAFFTFLTDEYARELLGEGGRRFHLIRWNLLKDKIDDTAQKFKDGYKKFHSLKNYILGQCFVSGKSELYPIPYREIVENKGSLGENNPGY